MSQRAKTTQEFQDELNQKYPNKYTIIGNYVNARTKVKIVYNSCGHENDVIPSNLLGGFNCHICRNEHRVTPEQFVEKIYKKHKDKYTILGTYTNNTTPIEVRYNNCGHVAKTKPFRILAGKECPICNPYKRLTNDDIRKRLHDMYGDEYQLVGDYVNNTTDIKIKHIVCGNDFDKKPVNIFREKHDLCPICFSSARGGCLIQGVNDIHTLKPELERFMLNMEDAYSFTPNSNKDIMWKCPECGHEFPRTIYNVANRGFGCELCGSKISYGERFVMELLKYLDVDFEVQFLPKWVDYSRYDFAFKVGDIDYIVEVDGGWHFVDNKMSGQTAEETVLKDRLKELAAMKNGYTVIRIDYNYGDHNRYDYIENSVLNSPLAELFDLSLVDFLIIHNNAKSSLLMKVANAWNGYEEKSTYQIKKDLNLKDYTAREILYLASRLGLIKESVDEIIKLNRLHACKIEGKLPQKVMRNETGEIFECMQAANDKYHASLTNYFKYNYKTSGHLPNGTRLTWKKVED